MISFPTAKINLGLNIVERRPDGYHNLQTVFYPVPLCDALELLPADGTHTGCRLELPGGHALDCACEDNLVVKAYRLLAADHDLPGMDVRLLKQIPSGAGLGGGSADAAFMLKMLNEQCALSLSDDDLRGYAVKLGADCAFFIRNQAVYAEGIGERFTPVDLSLQGHPIVVVKPDVFISTREAFAQVHPQQPAESLQTVIAAPLTEWKERMVNDFEQSVFPRFPEVAHIKQQLYERGALYASMSGSGSSVFGLFEKGEELPPLELPDGCFHWQGVLG